MDTDFAAARSLMAGVSPFLPRIAGALAIIVVAWIASRVVRAVVRRAGERLRLDERSGHAGLSALLGSVAHAAVWLLALPPLLGTLELHPLLVPVNAMITRMLGYLPNVLAALVIGGIGVVVANIARQLVASLLTATGSERLAQRIGLASSLGERSLADILASIVFALILLPVLAAALDALGIDTVSRPVSQLLDAVIMLIPRLLSATLIIVIAAVLGRVLAGVVSGLLAGLGANELPRHLGLDPERRIGGRDVSELGGLVVTAAVLFVALAQASEVIGLTMLTQAVAGLGGVFANMVVALVIMVAGLWLANLAVQLIEARNGPHAHLGGLVTRVAILFFAGALALRQSGLPPEIVTLLFGSVVVGLALGAAIAIGLGGRKVVGDLLASAVVALKKRSDDASAPKGE